MAILTYRSVKESALTYNEMDDNFKYFKENPELNSIKISVKDNLDDIASLPIGSITGGLDWNINDDVEELNTDFRLFVKTSDTLWDPIVTQGTVVEVNTATADIKGIVKVGPSLTIDTEGLLEVDKFTDASISSYVGETRYIQTDGTAVGWLPFDINANLPNQSNQQGHYLMSNGSQAGWFPVDALPSQSGQNSRFLTTNGTDASWATVDALPSRVGEQGKILHVNSSSEAEWTNSLDENTTLDNTVTSTDNSKKIATTAFVKTAISNLIDNAPSTLDTLDEIAAALNDDASLYTTLVDMMPHDTTPLNISGNNLTFKYHNNTTATSIQLWVTQPYATNNTSVATTAFVHSQFDHDITVSGTVTANDFIIPSDRTLKTNIKPLDVDTINLLGEIDAVTFTNLSGEDDIGFIAQDFNKHIPVLTTTTEDELLSLKYSKITAILWKQNQELLRRIEALENK